MADRTKRPAFQWYPGDWQRDTALRACSLEARGLWIEMLNLMHDGIPYGHLTAGPVPIEPLTLAGMVGVKPAKRVTALLAELEAHGVFSRTDAGVIYSRRMVKDERIRGVRAESGRLGGNPDLVNQNGSKGPSKGQPLHLPSAVASASASNPSQNKGGLVDTGEASLLVAKIRSLAEESNSPAQGVVKFIRREKVLELGPDVAKVFDALGGGDRILKADGKEYGYMVRDVALTLKAIRGAAWPNS